MYKVHCWPCKRCLASADIWRPHSDHTWGLGHCSSHCRTRQLTSVWQGKNNWGAFAKKKIFFPYKYSVETRRVLTPSQCFYPWTELIDWSIHSWLLFLINIKYSSHFFNSVTNFSLPLLLWQLETNQAASPFPSFWVFLERLTWLCPNCWMWASRLLSGGGAI